MQGQRLVVDLDFEGLMTAAEVSSICNQLMHAYSANSRAAVPCHLHFTSVKVLLECFCVCAHGVDRLFHHGSSWRVVAAFSMLMEGASSVQYIVMVSHKSAVDPGKLNRYPVACNVGCYPAAASTSALWLRELEGKYCALDHSSGLWGTDHGKVSAAVGEPPLPYRSHEALSLTSTCLRKSSSGWCT